MILMRKRTYLLAFGLIVAFAATAQAQGEKSAKKTESDVIKLPAPTEIKELQIAPADIKLVGEDDARQIVLSGILTSGGNQDLTGDVEYEVADSKIARITSAGRIVPLANGTTTITARYGAKTVKANV